MEEYLKVIKSLSESTRIRILALLLQAREVCVSDIVEALQENQYKVSRHLKVLQETSFVKSNRKGRWIYYQLNNEEVSFKQALLDAVSNISSDTLSEDIERLKKVIENKYGCNKNIIKHG